MCFNFFQSDDDSFIRAARDLLLIIQVYIVRTLASIHRTRVSIHRTRVSIHRTLVSIHRTRVSIHRTRVSILAVSICLCETDKCCSYLHRLNINLLFSFAPTGCLVGFEPTTSQRSDNETTPNLITIKLNNFRTTPI